MTGEDFLVSAIGLRKDIYERVGRMRLARKGEGVRIIEVAPPASAAVRGPQTAREREPRHARPKPVESNPLSPFSDGELRSHRRRGRGTRRRSCDRCRQASMSARRSRARVADPDLAVLLADLWERPGHHVDSFATGGAPRLADVVVDEEELAAASRRARAKPSSSRHETEGQIRRLLDGTIEEWMVYLHPSQRAIVRADFNGPARVRGGPGTGKTVVALHRARRLARERLKASGCSSRRSCARSRRFGRA